MRARKISETGMEESVCACAIALRLVRGTALIPVDGFQECLSSTREENGDLIMEPRQYALVANVSTNETKNAMLSIRAFGAE
jgi:hypothetical protein